MTGPIHFREELGEGVHLDCYSLSSSLTRDGLVAVVKRESAKEFPKTTKAVTLVSDFNDYENLQLQVSRQDYSVPEKLKPYRTALGHRLDAQRKPGMEFPRNGSVAVVVGPVTNPLTVCQGGYYDYKATDLQAVPANLEVALSESPKLSEALEQMAQSDPSKLLLPSSLALQRLKDSYNLIKGVYPNGRTIRQLFADWGLDEDQRARYLGVSHLLFANNGRELVLVQRAKDLGIAADCISTPGSTPDPRVRSGLKLGPFMKTHLDREMDEEFGLFPNEFSISGFGLYDDRDGMPFMAVRITTGLSAAELAKRCFDDPQVLKEHYVLYSVKSEDAKSLPKKIPLFYSVVPCIENLK